MPAGAWTRRPAWPPRASPATCPAFHPSFRFEERLAARLAEAAAAMRLPAAAGAEGSVPRFRLPAPISP